MRHRKHRHLLGRKKEHRDATLGNLATALFQHGRIETTLAKAKALRPFAEKLITKAKDAYLLPAESALHQRRLVAAKLCFGKRKCPAMQVLFDKVAKAVQGRPGGYTRIFKLSPRRRGDGAEMAIIEIITEPCKRPAPNLSVVEQARGRRVAAYRGAVNLEVAETKTFFKSNREDSTRMNRAREFSDGQQRVRLAYPIPHASYIGGCENGVAHVGNPLTVQIGFEKEYHEHTRQYVERLGLRAVTKIGAAIDPPVFLKLEDAIYKEIPFSVDGDLERLVFRLTPIARGKEIIRFHVFDQSEYKGTCELQVRVK